MGKQSVPIKARKAGGASSSGGSQQHKSSSSHGAGGGGGGGGGHSNKKKHGGFGSTNAFENLTYRSKHHVLQLGKAKGKLKRPAQSLSHSLAQRQASLLAELGAREKANSFTDERLQEGDDTVDMEDKLLLRFQRERQKRLSKSSSFNLADDPLAEGEEGEQLTHLGEKVGREAGGRRFGDDDYEENQSLDDEGRPKKDSFEAQEAELQRRSDREQKQKQGKRNAGHGDLDEEEKEGMDANDADGDEHAAVKSKHEVMSEVMLKSKLFRAERAVLAGEQSDLMGNLDAEFDAIRNQMSFVSNKDREEERKATRDAERKADLALAAAKKKSSAAGGAEEDNAMEVDYAELDPTDEFVLEARQLGLDVRAKATDRLKTDEELIVQEKKRLERLEKQRLKRMRGENEAAAAGGEGEEGSGSDGEDRPSKRRRKERKAAAAAASASSKGSNKARKPTDDDLDENFTLTGKAIREDAKDETDLISDDEGGHKGNDDDDDDEDEDDDEEDSDEEGDEGAESGEEEEEEEEEDEDAPSKSSKAKKRSSADDDDGTDAPLKAIFIGSDTKGKSNAAAAAAAGPKEIFIGKDGKSSVSNALLALTGKVGGSKPAVAAPAAGSKAAKDSSSSSSSARPVDPDANLPFTFVSPTSYKDFRALLAQYPVRQHSLIMHRIKTCNHISLAPENRQKMEKFLSILLTHFRRLCQDFAKRNDEGEEEKDKEGNSTAKSSSEATLLLQRLDELGRHISELCEIPSMNLAVGRAFRNQIEKIREEFEGEDAAAAADSNATKKAPPHTIQADHLFFFKLLFSLFPTSDFRHNVVTPSLLLAGEMLNRCLVFNGQQLLRGFFLVALVLHAVSASRRLVPELMSFMHASLLVGMGIQRKENQALPAAAPAAAASKKATDGKSAGVVVNSSGGVFSVVASPLRLHQSLQTRNVNFVPSTTLALWSSLIAPTAAAADKSSKSKKQAAPEEESDLHLPLEWLFLSSEAAHFTAPASAAYASVATRSLSTLLQLIHQCAQLYQGESTCYAELFTPFLDALRFIVDKNAAEQKGTNKKNNSLPNMNRTLQAYISHLVSYFEASIQHSISLRQPLQASLAPLALKTHQPLFVEGYNPTKDYDPLKERAEMKKLNQKLKKEKKGALRELRRDTAVVVQQQRQLSNAYAAEREAKRKENWQQMEEQQRDTNIMQRESKKKERKEGKKGSKKK